MGKAKYSDGVDNASGDDGRSQLDDDRPCCPPGMGGVASLRFTNGYQETLPASPGKVRGQESR